MPESIELIELLVKPIADAKLPYMVTGSVASILFGEARLTKDVDIVLFLKFLDAMKLEKVFPNPEYYCPPAETIRDEMGRARGMVNVIHPASGLKADLFFAEIDDLYDWAFAHRRIVRLNEYPYFFAPPEFVILKKLQYFMEGNGDKHIRDIEGILFVHAARIDSNYLERGIQARGLAAAWAHVKKAPPSRNSSI